MRKIVAVAELDEIEMACRLAEAVIGAERPSGTTAGQALSHLDPGSRDAFRRAAIAAFKYMAEQINAGERVQ